MKKIVWIFITVCQLFHFSIELDEFSDIDTSNVVVEFKPFVSIWDEYEDNRYDMDRLILLISKVASRFSKIYIDLNDRYISQMFEDNMNLSLFAAANYNCHHTSTNPVEVWLGIRTRSCRCDYVMEEANILADAVNEECPGTVTTILLRKDWDFVCKQNICTKKYLTNRYSWAILNTFTDFCEGNTNPNGWFSPAFVVLEYSNVEDLSKNMTQCKFPIESKNYSLSILKKLNFSDTDKSGLVNMTRLVNAWKLGISGDKKCILSQAFDSYNYKAKIWETNGWWYVERANLSAQTETYIFEEKIRVTQKVDFKENPREFGWLKKSKIFNKSRTGILYTGKLSLDQYSNDFCRVLFKHDSGSHPKPLPKPTMKFSASCKARSHLVILAFSQVSDEYANLILKANWDHITVVFFVQSRDTINGTYSINSSHLLKLGKLKIQYGYFFDIKICKFFSGSEMSLPNEKEELLKIVKDPNSTMYLFNFKETKRSLNLGATRRFRQRSVMFEACKEMIKRNRNSSVEIGYIMQQFHVETNFYSSPVDMQNFVRYVDLLTTWCEQQEHCVVFIGQDTASKEDWQIASWYTYDKENHKYLSLREKALKLSNLRFPTQEQYLQSSLSKSHIILIILISIGVFTVLFVLSTYYVRSHYRESSITDYEINNFFKGNGDSNECEPHKVPYDKNRYEITSSQFRIHTGAPLGSGEFGKVYRGIISTTKGEVKVAIKTTNPQKQHSTMLNGLLTEIKVLAYVGKHVNITELLGANTCKLKDGKVYIFLELCHLGSLEKYLREMRSLVKVPLNTDNSNVESCYVNGCVNARTMLDASLSEDLFRWSTEICNGMAYLSEKHVVHADLATRNVLLNLRREAKICDFGLSRRMYNYTNYVKTQQEPLPWKWMAPESLRCMQFTEKSDVWAYGITVWEIYSLGSTPYAGMSWNIDFAQMLEEGLTLSEPEFIDQNRSKILHLINKCRLILPEERPKFSLILLQLTE